MSKLVVFGASGATGREVVKAALAQGHVVTAFVRDSAKVGTDDVRLRVVIGDVMDERAVAAAIVGQDVVICTLGAPASSRARVREIGTRNILAGMRASGVRRVLVQSTYGLGNTRATLPWFVRSVVIPFWLDRAFADHVEQEFLVRGADVDWTLVLPPFLVDGAATGNVRSDDLEATPAPAWKISRADVAAVLVARAADGGWSRRAVPVTW